MEKTPSLLEAATRHAVQADVEATTSYILNDFLARHGRPERVDLMHNLHYRRDRFYRHGGGPREGSGGGAAD